MKISMKIIRACRKAGACKEGLTWISSKPRTIEQLYKYDVSWFLWLRNIFSKSDRDVYDAAVKPACDAYAAAVKPACDAYAAAVKSASDAYDAAVKPARDAYAAAVKLALIKALRKDGYR